MRRSLPIWCRVQKRDENSPIGFVQLLPPFKHIVTFIGIPSVNWEDFLRRKYGKGEYLVTAFGPSLKGVVKIWHGTV